MSGNSQPSIERSPGILRRIDSLVDKAPGATCMVVAGLALGAVGTAVEGSIDAAAASAMSPAAHTSTRHRPKLIQEYATVEGGDSHMIQEKCKAGSRAVKRQVAYRHPDQPLGKCDLGSSVTVTDVTSGARKKVAHANRKNNHFVFDERPGQPQPGGSTGGDGGSGGGGGGDTGGGGGETDPYASGNVGVDISWPQCGTANATPSGYDFGIVGVNAGLSFSINPCLATEAANFPGNQLSLYVNTSWNSNSSHINPDSPRSCAAGDENCLAYNLGYNAGIYAVGGAIDAGITVNRKWWVDTESDATWSSDTDQNQQSILGQRDALIDNGATAVGAYSTTIQWNDITGGWQNGWDSWGATTWDNAADAMTFCTGHEFTGGPSKMMQFLPGGIDHDVVC